MRRKENFKMLKFNPIGLVTFFSVLKPIDEKTILLKNTNINHSNLNSKLSAIRGSFSLSTHHKNYKQYLSKTSYYSVRILRGISTSSIVFSGKGRTVLRLGRIIPDVHKAQSHARVCSFWDAYNRAKLKLLKDLTRYERIKFFSSSAQMKDLVFLRKLKQILIFYKSILIDNKENIDFNSILKERISKTVRPVIILRLNSVKHSLIAEKLKLLSLKHSRLLYFEFNGEIIFAINKSSKNQNLINLWLEEASLSMRVGALTHRSLAAILNLYLELNSYHMDLFFHTHILNEFLQSADVPPVLRSFNEEVFKNLLHRVQNSTIKFSSQSNFVTHILPFFRLVRFVNDDAYLIEDFLRDELCGGFLSESKNYGNCGDVFFKSRENRYLVEIKRYQEVDFNLTSEISHLARLPKPLYSLARKFPDLMSQMLRSDDLRSILFGYEIDVKFMILIELDSTPTLKALIFLPDFESYIQDLIFEINEQKSFKILGLTLTEITLLQEAHSARQDNVKVFEVKGYLNSNVPQFFTYQVVFIASNPEVDGSLDLASFISSSFYKDLLETFDLFTN